MPFDDFKTPAVPKDFDTYVEYRRRSIEFIAARNRRIERYAASQDDELRKARPDKAVALRSYR
jgi:hypothetical protein